MKLVKLSLVAIMTMGTMACAGDSLVDAFKNGKVSGELRFVYTSGSKTDATTQTRPVNNANVGSIAATVNYVTDDFYGFKLGLGFESAHDLNFHDVDGGSEDDQRNSISKTLLQNAYIQYAFMKSNIKVGRQTIKLPLIMTSSAFALEDSFDAAVLTINEIPNTMLKVVYIQDWNMRYGGDSKYSSVTQQDVHYKDGLYSIYVNNKSIQNLMLEAQYLTTNDKKINGDAPVLVAGGYDEYFVRANYKLPIDFPLTLGATYAGASFDADGKDDARLYGFIAKTNLSDVKLNVAYTTMGDDASFPGTLGHVPDTISYTDMLTNNSIFAGIDAYSVEAIYGFGITSFSSAIKYAHYDQSDEGIAKSAMDLDGADEINIDLKYAFSGALKGLSTRIWAGYGKYDVSGEDTFKYARVYLKYNF